MPNLKDLKLQIKSVGSTKKITSAMKMVAASKLRRSQEQAESAKPYSARLEEMLSSLSSNIISDDKILRLLTGTGKKDKYLIVPVTADRGLCGGFNSSINRETVKYIRKLEKENKEINLMTIGKKSRDFFSRIMKNKISESFIDLGSTNLKYVIRKPQEGKTFICLENIKKEHHIVHFIITMNTIKSTKQFYERVLKKFGVSNVCTYNSTNNSEEDIKHATNE